VGGGGRIGVMERLMLLLLRSSSVEWRWVIRSEREFCSSDPSEILVFSWGSVERKRGCSGLRVVREDLKERSKRSEGRRTLCASRPGKTSGEDEGGGGF